ncbi:helix-turn-helix domain-containing protein [Nitrosomonas oligotropha]|uniref:helix-turn-helix domain-containing protein n=1 Tax=Nitrosomonas oligotropha TaxID=42354 RepID=UPI001C409B59
MDRQEIWRLYQTRLWKVAHLAERFHVSRPTIYDVLKRTRLQEFTPSAITSLTQASWFTSIPSDFPC